LLHKGFHILTQVVANAPERSPDAVAQVSNPAGGTRLVARRLPGRARCDHSCTYAVAHPSVGWLADGRVGTVRAGC